MNQKTLSHDYKSEGIKDNLPVAAAEDWYLIEQIALRNGEAFTELYRRFSSMLFNFLLSLVGDRHAAEDLLQEVFLAVWKGARKYRGAAAVKTWLFNIAYKQGISWLRKRKDIVLEDLDLFLAAPASQDVSPDPIQSQIILQALKQLTPQHRAVLELIFYYEMTYREAAEVLGCPVGTVKSRVSYARKQMQARISSQIIIAGDNLKL